MGNLLVIASEIKALLAAGIPAAWDGQGVHQSVNLCLQNKALLRQAVALDVTPRVLQGAKKPFMAPPAHRALYLMAHQIVN